jgi:hypothetical protein
VKLKNCLTTAWIATGLLTGCGNDEVAGRSTTTTNGDGVIAIGMDGTPRHSAYALFISQWDSIRGTAIGIDTVRTDANGILRIPKTRFTFVEIQDPLDSTALWMHSGDLFPGNLTPVRLLTTHTLKGRWLDFLTEPGARVYIDSSLRSSPLGPNGEFRFDNMPQGTHALRLANAKGSTRPMGLFNLSGVGIVYSGAANLSITGLQTPAPFWIDDFEAGSVFPMAKSGIPNLTRWYMLVVNSTLSQPRSTQMDTLREAFRYDSARGSRVFETKYITNPDFATVGLGSHGYHSNLLERTEFCLAYRSDRAIQIQLHRDKVGDSTPMFKVNLDSSLVWKDACVRFSDFKKATGTPDSLGTWSTFGRDILTIHILGSVGSTYLGLDDIRIR